jgi:hypothetical protein
MTPQARIILQAFDAPQHGAHVMTGIALERIGDSADLQPLAEELVAEGLLRHSDGGTYTRTEEGRLALARPLDVTLYTRKGCHLCEEAKAQIAPLLRSAGARLHEIDIDDDNALRERYNVDIPVILLGRRKVAKHRVDLGQFRRQLQEACREGSSSSLGTEPSD